MTDTALVPGQMRSADAEAPAEAQNDRRPLLFVGVGALAVVVGIVAYFLFFTGGSSAPAPAVPATPNAAKAQPAAPAAPGTAPQTTPVKNARVAHSFRDPFKALISADTGGAAAASSTVTSGTSTPSGTGTTTTPTTTGGTSTGATGSAGSTATTGSSGTTAPEASASHRVRVVAVHGKNTSIDVMVDGKLYSGLHAGQVFAKFFKVVGIGGPVNAVQFGDVKFNITGNKSVTLSS